jgi:uncharacterized protein (DUF1684 family)
MRRIVFTVRAWHAWLEERDGSVFDAEVETNHEAFRMAHWLRAQGLRVRVTGPDGSLVEKDDDQGRRRTDKANRLT